MNKSLVTIIIPTYNRHDYLGETLDSVLGQSYQNWECIIVDDGSNDYTKELVEWYIARSTRIKYFERPDNLPKGANSCRNYGYELSQGEYIMWLDDDDLLDAKKLEKQLEVAIPGSTCLMTCAWGRLVVDKTNRMDLSIYRDYRDSINLLVDYAKLEYFPPHVFLVSRLLVEKSEAWNTDLKINQDGVFFANIILNASQIKFAPGTQVYYRAHTGNNTSNLNSKSTPTLQLSSENSILYSKEINLFTGDDYSRLGAHLPPKAQLSCAGGS